MTRADKFEEIFGYRPATDNVLCNEHEWCGESDACNYCICNPNNIGRDEDWWNAEYKEPTTKNDLGVDCISRAQTQTEIEMCASRYTIAKERGGMGQVEWSDHLIKVSDAVDIIRNLPSVTPQEPFINKPCVSSEVCEHDKNKVLDKIDEIITDALDKSTDQKESQTLRWVLDKISEVDNGNDK